MSHASLTNAATGDIGAWKSRNRLSLAGITDTAMPFFLNQHSEVRELVFCLDNDDPGREAAALMMKKYTDKGYSARIELPHRKDFNEDLQALRTQEKAEKRTKTLHKNASI
jgi:DNA primase